MVAINYMIKCYFFPIRSFMLKFLMFEHCSFQLSCSFEVIHRKKLVWYSRLKQYYMPFSHLVSFGMWLIFSDFVCTSATIKLSKAIWDRHLIGFNPPLYFHPYLSFLPLLKVSILCDNISYHSLFFLFKEGFWFFHKLKLRWVSVKQKLSCKYGYVSGEVTLKTTKKPNYIHSSEGRSVLSLCLHHHPGKSMLVRSGFLWEGLYIYLGQWLPRNLDHFGESLCKQ